MQNLKVFHESPKKKSSRSSSIQSSNGKIGTTAGQTSKPQKEVVDTVQEQHLCLLCKKLMVQPYLPPCKHRICHYCVNKHHKGTVNKCQVCTQWWVAPYALYADYDFERELKTTYGKTYIQEKAKIQKKILMYEDFYYDLHLPLKEIGVESIDSDDELNQEKNTPESKDIIDYDPDTPMGQMQKMFGWNRDQQEWAQHVLKDKGSKHRSKNKFRDPFKNLGWDSHF